MRRMSTTVDVGLRAFLKIGWCLRKGDNYLEDYGYDYVVQWYENMRAVLVAKKAGDHIKCCLIPV